MRFMPIAEYSTGSSWLAGQDTSGTFNRVWPGVLPYRLGEVIRDK
jgi:hypothetical protein